MQPPRRVHRPLLRGSSTLEFLFGLLFGLFISLIASSSMALSRSPLLNPVRGPFSATSFISSSPLQSSNIHRGQKRPGLVREPVVACMVLPTENSWVVPGVVNATWGSRCDRLVFVGPRAIEISGEFESLTVGKAGQDANDDWAGFAEVFERFDMRDADYLFVVEDETYAIPDNLRYETRGSGLADPTREHLYLGRMAKDGVGCDPRAFALSRATTDFLKSAIRRDSYDEETKLTSACSKFNEKEGKGHVRLAQCLKTTLVKCKEARDFQGKHQFLKDPTKLLAMQDVPARELPGEECCSSLPLAFLSVGKTMAIKTGTYSNLYLYDYFIRGTAVYGLEYMRPMVGVDAGANKAQIGF